MFNAVATWWCQVTYGQKQCHPCSVLAPAWLGTLFTLMQAPAQGFVRSTVAVFKVTIFI